MEVKMLKKCTRLWREGHLEVNIAKTHAMFGPLLGAQKKAHAVVVRSMFATQKR